MFHAIGRAQAFYLKEGFMPTIRLLYTLEEIKKLLADKHHVPIVNVTTFNSESLSMDYGGGDSEVKEDNFLFQVDK